MGYEFEPGYLNNTHDMRNQKIETHPKTFSTFILSLANFVYIVDSNRHQKQSVDTFQHQFQTTNDKSVLKSNTVSTSNGPPLNPVLLCIALHFASVFFNQKRNKNVKDEKNIRITHRRLFHTFGAQAQHSTTQVILLVSYCVCTALLLACNHSST